MIFNNLLLNKNRQFRKINAPPPPIMPMNSLNPPPLYPNNQFGPPPVANSMRPVDNFSPLMKLVSDMANINIPNQNRRAQPYLVPPPLHQANNPLPPPPLDSPMNMNPIPPSLNNNNTSPLYRMNSLNPRPPPLNTGQNPNNKSFSDFLKDMANNDNSFYDPNANGGVNNMRRRGSFQNPIPPPRLPPKNIQPDNPLLKMLDRNEGNHDQAPSPFMPINSGPSDNSFYGNSNGMFGQNR